MERKAAATMKNVRINWESIYRLRSVTRNYQCMNRWTTIKPMATIASPEMFERAR